MNSNDTRYIKLINVNYLVITLFGKLKKCYKSYLIIILHQKFNTLHTYQILYLVLR